MLIPTAEVKINPGRRTANPEHIQELAKSIAEIGLLNPITVDHRHILIAGLHRLEAAKLLDWPEIECTVSNLEGLQAELAEIDENFIRSDLSPVEYGDLLLRRKRIYESLYPESKNGGDRKSEKIRAAKCRSDSVKSFVQDTADKLGVAPRTVERQIQTAKNLAPDAKEIIRSADAKITKKDALKLSRMEPEQQKEAASQLVSGEIRSVDDYQSAAQSEHSPAIAAAGSPSKAAQPSEKSEPPQNMRQTERTQPPPVPPFTPDGRRFATVAESIADLKNLDKDCRCTPDSFLAEITAFTQKFQRDTEWYSSPYYEVVFPALTPEQVDYLRQQFDSIHAATADLFKKVKGL